ncbi:MAG: hypothetical protein VX589_01475 [Myxococcota bacterium]|nr:hypothetical protein [Myxococcota bacterium]
MRLLFSAMALAFLVFGCASERLGVPPPNDRLDTPISIVKHPSGRYLYIANAGFEREFRGGRIAVYDLQQHRFLDEASLEIGLFAGQLGLRAYTDGDGDEKLMGIAVTRDPSAFVQFNVDATRGDSPKHFDSTSIATTFDGGKFADAPYGVAVDDEGVTVTHLNGRAVSRWLVDSEDPGRIVFGCSLNLSAGASMVARHPNTGDWYITDRRGTQVTVIKASPAAAAGEGDAINAGCELTVVDTTELNSLGSRGIAFSADGSLMYLASLSEEALRVYDTSVGVGGIARKRLLHLQPLGGVPTTVSVAGCRPCECPTGPVGPNCPAQVTLPGSALDRLGNGLVYVSVYNENKVIAFDPSTRSVVGRIEVGTTPYELAIAVDNYERIRGYAVNFKGDAISVIELTPGDPRQFKLIAVAD